MRSSSSFSGNTTQDDQDRRRTADVDLEKQEGSAHPPREFDEKKGDEVSQTVPHDHVTHVLDALQVKLAELLNAHIKEIGVIHRNPARGRKSLQADDSSKRHDHDGARIHIHVKHLDEFLENYAQNVRVLQQRLNNKFPEGQDQKADEVDIEPKVYESMLQQFNSQVLVSTFTAALIVGFCALAKTLQIAGDHAQLLYNIGLFISLLSTSLHVFNIIISGRCAALCSSHSLVQEHTLAYFHGALATCEQLYLHGIILFAVALLELSFVMFNNIAYPAALCGVVGLAIVALATGRLRKLSVMYQNVVRIKALMWTLGGKVAGKRRK